MVDQHPQPMAGPGGEGADHLGQVVDAVQPLDRHSLNPEVVAPHPLHQRRVVDTFDQDAAGPGHDSPLPGHRHRPGCADVGGSGRPDR